MQKPTDSSDVRYLLGLPHMDETHGEFVDMVSRLAEVPDAQFAPLFQQLLVHTAAHFEFEHDLMRQSRFPDLDEHREEHRRVLNQMREFLDRLSSGDTAPDRIYVREHLPAWFDDHTTGMDRVLAEHVKEHLL